MNLNESNYKLYVDTAYKYFLRNKNGDERLDKMLDKIDIFIFNPGVKYYRIDDYDFELYRLKRRILQGNTNGFTNSSIEDILNGKINQNKMNEKIEFDVNSFSNTNDSLL